GELAAVVLAPVAVLVGEDGLAHQGAEGVLVERTEGVDGEFGQRHEVVRPECADEHGGAPLGLRARGPGRETGTSAGPLTAGERRRAGPSVTRALSGVTLHDARIRPGPAGSPGLTAAGHGADAVRARGAVGSAAVSGRPAGGGGDGRPGGNRTGSGRPRGPGSRGRRTPAAGSPSRTARGRGRRSGAGTSRPAGAR